MPYTQQDRLVALAGIFQAALCVRQIARQGSVDTDMMQPCVYSLFQTDPEGVDAVFGAPGCLHPGVRALLGGPVAPERNAEVAYYVVAIMKLERVLVRHGEMVRAIAEGIEKLGERLDEVHLLDPELLAGLAEIYSSTVSHLRPRIMVKGEALYLHNEDNQNRIRALLLAGVRAAWLWRQVGGTRWQLRLAPLKLADAARGYLRRTYH